VNEIAVGGSILGSSGEIRSWKRLVQYDGELLLGNCVCLDAVRVVSVTDGYGKKAWSTVH
jgi:hypothetical protein